MKENTVTQVCRTTGTKNERSISDSSNKCRQAEVEGQ